MAILQDDGKLLDSQEQDQNQPQAMGGESALVSGGQGANVGTGGQSAGVGKGGTGSWTNIQSYLGANKGDTGTADYVQNKIGSQFNQEKTDLEKSANDTKTQAQSQSQKVVDTKNNADNLLNEATKTYDWSKSAQNYGAAGDQLRSGLYGAYSGPQNFTYSIGDKTQKYGTALNNGDAFKKFLNDSYQERAGSPMSSGQLALQRQFDSTNDPLAAKKQELANQYTGLQDTVNSTVKDTDAALVNSQRDYRNAQSDLADYLRGNLNKTDTEIAQKESGAKNEFGQMIAAPYSDDFLNSVGGAGRQYIQNARERAGVNSIGALENFFDNDANWGGKRQQYMNWVDANPNALESRAWNESFGALDQFNQAKRDQYKDTADAEKRKYNVLADFLNNNDRKKQGFDVVGRDKNARGDKYVG